MMNRKIVLVSASLFVTACATHGSQREPEPTRAVAEPAPTEPIANAPTTTSISNAVTEQAIEPPLRPHDPFTLLDEQGRPIEVYPPLSDAPKAPLVVVLHATCMQPASVCDWFGEAGRDVGWLVCPSGNSSCNGEPDWHGPGAEKAAFLDRAVAHVEHDLPAFVDDRPGVLIGWSRGAYAARDILHTLAEQPNLTSLGGRFRGVVFLAAQIAPDVDKLRAAGIERVVMAAGEQDGAKPARVASVARLQKKGIPARFVSLGKIGHVWPNDFDARMREPIAWAAGVDP
jgi:predicted esterase